MTTLSKKLVTLLGFIVLLTSCENKEQDIPISSISLGQATAEMLVGETVQLSATILPSNATENSVIWSSSKQSVATISNTGLVTAIAEGNSTITASCGGKSATCLVTVSKSYVAVISVTLNKTELTLEKGQSDSLTVTVNPSDATEKTVTWTSSDAQIAAVDEIGKVTAIKEGSATITAKAGEKSATCSVTVQEKVIAVTSITLNKSELTLEKGQSEMLVAIVKPDDATDKTVTWSSTDQEVVAVDNTGKVTAIKGGSAIITAKAGEKSATCSITITVPVESISVNKTTLELTEGESETLVAMVLPDDTTDKIVTWGSEDTSIATVDEGGKVSAISVGETSIIAMAGGKTANCKVIVNKDISAEIIVFSDTKVKEKLVGAFDTNGDGELSHAEAAAVTSGVDFKAAFGSIRTYNSFDEFQYFTGLTKIPDSMFEGWQQLTNITLPKSITYIGFSAFKYCASLTSIISIPEGVSSLSDNIFEGCALLPSVRIPNSVISIGNSAFKGCSGLTSITIPEGVTSISWSVFEECGSLSSIVIPESVTSIGRCAFKGCSGLTSITIPEGVTRIEESAFEGCSSLTSIAIPKSVTTIEQYVFAGCSSLTSITIPEGVISIDKYAFAGCGSLSSITIPESLTTTGRHTFINCNSLNQVYISNLSAWLCISFDSSPFDFSESGHLFLNGEELTNVYIPNEIKRISNKSFKGCTYITSVSIHDSVTYIGEHAFEGCTGLSSITIPNSVTFIGGGAFLGCSGLSSANIPDSITSISPGAFGDCSGLTSITIPDSVTSIGAGAFYACSGLKSITIPDSVTSIGNSAFQGCSGLTSILIPNGVTIIDNQTFSLCSSLTSVTLPEHLTSIGSSAFYGCGINTITIPASIKRIDGSFPYCSSLTSVTILASDVPEVTRPFYATPVSAIYVPAASVDAYKAANGWRDFAYMIFAIPD